MHSKINTLSSPSDLSISVSNIMAAFAYYLVFYLYMHACTARLLIASHQRSAAHLKFSSQDVETSDHFSGPKHGNNEGESTTLLHSSNILHQVTGKQMWKRSMLASELEESMRSSNDTNTMEDIVVMDYAQPHRKPPIHNKGT